MKADFGGYATKAGLECSDGRTITPEAFKHMDGKQVPLVWQHGHNNAENVLGHALLEAREDGVYCYAFFNDTKQGKNAKALVQHGDVKSLSIYANQLIEKAISKKAKQVLHGMIREVSLVLSGANPGALIDFVAIQHSSDPTDFTELEDEAIIHTGLNFELDVELEDDDDESTLGHAESDDLTIAEVVESMSELQRNVMNYFVGLALEETGSGGNSAAQSAIAPPPAAPAPVPTTEPNNATADSTSVDGGTTSEGDLTHQEGSSTVTTRNVFEQNGTQATAVAERKYLSHEDVQGIVQDALRNGKLSDAVEAYALKHGIDNIEVLFPDAQAIDAMPQFNKRRTEWVEGVLAGTRHSPFSRVKTVWADLTQAEARAKGYIKGSYKIEEWFGVTKRVTTPTTIYKKQKLERDDVVDITDFDVIAWIKQEMKLMLREEIARAVLLGDGRLVSDDDKIKDPMGAPAGDGIRSILNDHELFVTTVNVNVDDANSTYNEVVDAVMDGMEYYKGTGTPTLYTTIRQLNKFLKAKDTLGRRLYPTRTDVAEALGVAAIVTVEPMNDHPDLIGIIVNLDDYTIGADKGGEVSMFDDFDIDYNQQKYLIETRISGGLTKIKSALVIKSTGATDQLLATPTVPTFVATTGVVTIPTMTNVTYKNADTSATLVAGAQAALAEGESLNVQAVANAGYFFANDANTLWSFYRRPAA